MFSFSQSINEAAFEEFTAIPRDRMTSTYNRPVRFTEFAIAGHHVWVEMHAHTSERWNQERNVWEPVGDTWFAPRVYLGGAAQPEDGCFRDCPLYEAYMAENEFQFFHPTGRRLGEFTMKLHAWLQSDAATKAIAKADIK
jgi:hypothetical protein